MADGKTHAMVAGAGVLIGAGVGVLCVNAGLPEYGAAIVAGAIMGFLLTPDLDLEGLTEEEKRLRKIPIFGFLWQWFWYGYAMLFDHRGLSHKPVIGTATRLAYLLLLGVVATLLTLGVSTLLLGVGTLAIDDLAIMLLPWVWLIELVVTTPWVAVTFFAVWCMQDFGHLLLDTKTYKRMRSAPWLLLFFGGIALCIWWLARN